MLLDHACKYLEDTLCVQVKVQWGGTHTTASSSFRQIQISISSGSQYNMKPKTLCQLFCLLWHSLVASATAMWMPSYLNYACLYVLRHPKIARLQSEVQPPSQPQQSLQRYLRVSRPFILKIYISLPKKKKPFLGPGIIWMFKRQRQFHIT